MKPLFAVPGKILTRIQRKLLRDVYESRIPNSASVRDEYHERQGYGTCMKCGGMTFGGSLTWECTTCGSFSEDGRDPVIFPSDYDANGRYDVASLLREGRRSLVEFKRALVRKRRKT